MAEKVRRMAISDAEQLLVPSRKRLKLNLASMSSIKKVTGADLYKSGLISELTHHKNDITLQHYNGFGYVQSTAPTLWCDCLVSHTNCYGGQCMGNGTGSLLRSWVLNYYQNP